MAVNLFQQLTVNRRTSNRRLRAAHYGLCYLCDVTLSSIDYLVCRDCLSDLPFIQQCCPVCALPGMTGSPCAECLNSKQLFIDRSLSVFRYEYPVNHLIMDLKFHSRLPVAGFFANMLKIMATANYMDMPDIFIPVPLHSSRLAKRGFNQALVIAKHLSRQTGVPMMSNYCLRVRPTQSQSGLSATARRNNLKGAFIVNKPVLNSPLHAAIVDDVVTTGTTVCELARALTASGIKRIDVWSCCRAG